MFIIPALAGQWTLEVWSTAAAIYEEELPAESVTSIRDGVLYDDFQGDGTIRIDDANGKLEVRVDLTFDSDRLKSSFKADPCEFSLFDDLTPATGQTNEDQ